MITMIVTLERCLWTYLIEAVNIFIKSKMKDQIKLNGDWLYENISIEIEFQNAICE